MIGIYSGSFDPVHAGHIDFASQPIRLGMVTRVVLLAEQKPRTKTAVSDVAHRLVMLELATKKHHALVAATTPGDRFSIEQTLPYIYKTYGNDVAFLFGSDAFLRMSEKSWPGLEQMLKHKLIIGLRANDDERQIKLHAIKIGADIEIVHSQNHAHASSSHARAALGSTAQRQLLEPAVIRYIVANHLYGL